jgi:hypothetical protein
MPSSDAHTYDDELLTRYLLGDLPHDQSERVDELSITDEKFAWRLSRVENELVDAYVGGQLQGDTLKQFQTRYLASARRRERVEFAEALRGVQRRETPAPVPAKAVTGFFRQRWWAVPGPALLWGLSTAALAMMLAAGYLLFENGGLRRQVERARAQDGAAGEHSRQLEKEVSEQRAANAAAAKELERLREAGPDLGQLKTVSVLLPPPTRSLVRIKTVSVHSGTDLVVLLLSLDFDDFPKYQVALKEAAANQVVWRSRELEAAATSDKKAVTAAVPAGVLKARIYIVELSGVGKTKTEIVGNYPFKVVLR